MSQPRIGVVGGGLGGLAAACVLAARGHAVTLFERSSYLGGTAAECVRSHVPEPRVAQMIDHFTQYVGSSPDASPAVLCGIAHMQTQEGIWYPLGGTRAVPAALEKLARELGVEVRTECGVRR